MLESKLSLKHVLSYIKSSPANVVTSLVFMLGLLAVGYGLLQLSYFSQGELAVSAHELNTDQVEAKDTHIYVDVAGAVKKPGVVFLEVDDRLVAAIEAAGGLDNEADKHYVGQQLNLASKLTDGQKVYVPYYAETVEIVEGAENNDTLVTENVAGGLVSINSATQEQLDSLPNIGPKRAADIIAGRPYGSIDELVERKIISEQLFNELKPTLKL